MMQKTYKKTPANYLISIDARLSSRNSIVSVKAETWLHETQLSRGANIKQSRLFM